MVDASALAKYLLRERGWRNVEEYLERGVYSVDHVLKEASNAIWRHIVLSRVIDKTTGVKLYYGLKKLVEEGVVILEPQDRYLDSAFEIAISEGITVYDSLYIAQALEKGELLTSDKKQATIAKKIGIKVHQL